MRYYAGLRVTGALIALALFSSAAPAHHGGTGLYDTSQPIVIMGTVTSTTFSPPHPVLSVRVEDGEVPSIETNRPDEFTGPPQLRPDDVGQVRNVELSPVGMFFNLEDKVKVGDRIVILALRNCRAPNQLRSSWLQLANGEIVSHTRGLHRKTAGC